MLDAINNELQDSSIHQFIKQYYKILNDTMQEKHLSTDDDFLFRYTEFELSKAIIQEFGDQFATKLGKMLISSAME